MFDLKRLAINKIKSQQSIKNSEFFQFIHNDLVDRIRPIDKIFKEILIIQPSIENLLTTLLKEKHPNCNITITNNIPQTDPSEVKQFDLIIFPMGLHWVPDVQNFLATAHQYLQKNGILICNFPGGGSLQKLRYKLIELETANSNSHTPHISPFIQFEQVTTLLQQAGFAENIIDMEKLEIAHSSALNFMKTLKNTGESNALQNGISYSINKQMHRELSREQINHPFVDHINLITFISSPSKNSIKLKSEHFHG